MNDETKPAKNSEEPMIDARQASYALSLPYYWFADRKMRATRQIPHYLLGGLVRFRLSELESWSARHKKLPMAEVGA